MDIKEIKAKLGYNKLELAVSTTIDNKPTDWLRHWDNVGRVAVSIHKDLYAEIKAKPELGNLSLQTEVAEGETGPYTRQRIIKYTPAEFEL